MKLEGAKKDKAPENPSASASRGGAGTAASSPDGSLKTFINFHSPEFNHTDDLNDTSGNYRFFEPLDGIITADMRHQMERLRDKGCVNSPACEAAVSRKKEITVKRHEPETFEDLSSLTVISEGRTLIIDTDAVRAQKCGEILSEKRLTCTLVLTKKTAQDSSLSWFNRLTLIEADDVSVTGAFGSFSATVTAKGDQRHLPEPFDLVLDLQPTPFLAGRRLPMGYYAPGPNPEELNQVMAELPAMRGRFRKPQFMAFLKSRCFHGQSCTLDCRRCVEVCPFGAIQSMDGKISVNHYFCEGCGGCALVCPADAIRPVHPPREELLNILRKKLASQEAGDALPTTVVISDTGTACAEQLLHEDGSIEGSAVAFEVEEIGYVGLETILTAFSHGANRVLVVCGTENPQSIRDIVAWQTEMARAILRGLDMPEDKCQFVVPSSKKSPFEEKTSRAAGFDAQTYDTPVLSWTSSPGEERRALIRLATQHLCDSSGSRKPWLPLPTGSPFGAVAVKPGTCTLCMACSAACPSGALSASGDLPRLLFVEARCHQCGLCEETCPEHAIQLLPRMMCDPKTVETQVVLCEAETFRCIECNAPFAPQAMVNRMTEKLRDHWMYANERQLRRLQMCRVCRTRDALTSEDMKLWNR
ncbi:MAG: 4Fe-4S binding protein [Syntrophales bacterium]|jgi:ferredoxin